MKIKTNIGGILLLCALMSILPSCSDDSSDRIQPSSSAIFYVTPTPTATAVINPTTAPTPPMVTPEVPSSDDVFVKIKDFIPTAVTELKYATSDNFTKQVIYNFKDAYARYGTVKKLAEAARKLEDKGYYIKIWDAYRPVSAQYRLWDVCPDPTYVANPNVGYSNHTRGCAIDLTLVDANGNELLMPTTFDDFSAAADRDYSDVSVSAAEKARTLQSVMESCGFKGYYGEWWHFDDTNKYSPETVFEP